MSTGSSASTGSAGSSLPKGGPPKNRTAMYVGTALLAIGGYYLYRSGGDPNIAKKAVEHDATRASATVKGELPGSGKETQKSAEESMARVGSAVDSTVQDGKARISESEQKLRETRDQTSSAVLSKINEADQKVETNAAKAKSGISSWFGGK